MSTTVERAETGQHDGGPKYQVDIEGTHYPWDRDTITAADIRRLAGFPNDVPVIEVDLKTNAQRTLSETEEVEVFDIDEAMKIDIEDDEL